MLTTKISVTYDLKALDEDFDIYQIIKPAEYYIYNVLDSLKFDFKALSVQWSFGGKVLILLKKNAVTEEDFRKKISESEFPGLILNKVDLKDRNRMKKDIFYGSSEEYRLLIQLLLNSMTNSRNDMFSYSNIDGKLYYNVPGFKAAENRNVISFLEISINPGMYISLDVASFRKDNAGRMFFDESGNFRRISKKDDLNKIKIRYDRGSYKNIHNTLTAMNLRSYRAFENSKMGAFAHFLEDADRKLGKYVTIQLNSMESENIKEYKGEIIRNDLPKKKYGTYLNDRGLTIADENHTEKSKEISRILVHTLEAEYGITARTGPLSRDTFNIRIIFEPEHYADPELDPHNQDTGGCIIQHLIETNFPEEADARKTVISKLVKELVVKQEVAEGRIFNFNWPDFAKGREWCFATGRKIRSENKNEKVYMLDRLRILPDGQMKFDVIDGSKLRKEETSLEASLHRKFSEYDELAFRGKNEVECIFYSVDPEWTGRNAYIDIQAIFQTKESVIPNVKEIKEVLKMTQDSDLLDVSSLKDAMDMFAENNCRYSSSAEEWKAVLNKREGSIRRKDIRTLIRMQTDAGKAFNDYYHENYGEQIASRLRSKESTQFELYELQNIKYWCNPDDFEGLNTISYSVFPKSLRLSVARMSPVRKIIATSNKPSVEELLPLLDVDFVREGQYTVLPFPLKYIREYKKE